MLDFILIILLMMTNFILLVPAIFAGLVLFKMVKNKKEMYEYFETAKTWLADFFTKIKEYINNATSK